eukprot:CAMPEP_0177781102 /NCGR_PEP_ID=MMETSP0491_2-20121128/17635_1 /TAXON_ID=63592 /ORGANISM="Tetraselmis chuii, Strain PLY429" /LENGTH=460 /DNA_ID=CAMNT_0019301073 /DNA_START=417 /DNA_END=1800 /DNA_ORIENTATION=-
MGSTPTQVDTSSEEAKKTKHEESADFWSCPICMEMVYKPCVNSCGHVFCFWCMHRAMNTYEKSKCPCCRSEYSYFPWICEKLHEYLGLQFPKEYESRELVITEEEKDMDVMAPEVGAAGSSNGDIIAECFTCADPTCNAVLFRPTILNCGHMVCLDSCSIDSNGDPRKLCPACSAPIVGMPSLCHKVHDFLHAVVPEGQSQRAIAVKLIVDARRAAASAAGSSTSGQPGEEAVAESDVKSLDEDYLQRLNEMKKNFVHHGVGCDVCGMLPIVGQRFRCKTCSVFEKMGYDMCGSCMSSNPETCRGRFNQHHSPDHAMVEVETRPSLIHIFQAMNPGVPLSHLQDLLRMQYGPHDDDEDGNEVGEDFPDHFDVDVEVEVMEDIISADDGDDSGGEDRTVASSPDISPAVGGIRAQQPDLNTAHTHVPMFHRVPAWQPDSDAALEQTLDNDSTDAPRSDDDL